MAGQPTFERSKRTIHFHTSHKSIYEGAETQHVKTNSVASIDGSYTASIGGNFTLNASKIIFKDPVVFNSTASLDGDLKVGGDLYVTGSVIVVATVLHMGDNTFGDSATDNQKFVGISTASGDLTVNSDLHVKTNASVDGTLAVAGITTLTDVLHAKSTASLDGNLTVAGNETLTGSLLVDKNASIDGTLAVGGTITAEGTTHIKGTASLDSNLVVAGNETLTGSLLVDKNASVDGILSVGGKGIVTGVLHAKTTASLDSDLNVAGNGIITGSLLVDKNASIDGALAVGGITTLAGALKAQSTASLDGTLDVGGETDLHYNKLVNVKNVLRTEKITITHANLLTASRIDTVTLFRASPGDTIYDIVGNSRVSWKQNATIDLLRLEVGDLYDPNGFAVSHLASPIGWIWDLQTSADKGAYLRTAGASLIRNHKTYTAATLIKAAFNASYCWVASLTAGEIDIYVDVMSRA